MILTQHFDSLDGLRLKTEPLATYTQPTASVLRIATLPINGYAVAEFYIDFGNTVKINTVELGIVGVSGIFSFNGSVGTLYVKNGNSYGVFDPYPVRTVIQDYSNVPPDINIETEYSFGILRDGGSADVGYIDIDFITIDYDIIIPPEPLITKKLYRYKISSTTAGKFPVFFKRDGLTVASQCVEFKPHCSGGKVLKFMDRNGIYRFFPFNEFWEQNNEPDAIGSAELFTDSIYTGQSNRRSLGYKNKRSIAAVAYEVTAYELDILQDLMTSPFVYLYIGTTGDAPKDWLLVEVSGTNTGRRRKGVIGRYEVTIVLPEQFNITML